MITALLLGTALAKRSFTVDTSQKTFLKDGKPFNYVSGSFHYSRVPPYYWRDRLQKMYAAGLDAIQFYVPWNVHEPYPGQYDFEGQQDLVRFITIAHEVGLLVLLRAGPYICGEWEYGGFPAWLLTENPNMIVRSSDPSFLKPVDAWFGEFLPKIKPLLYENGGPVVMVQLENEYGSYFACDKDYISHLISLARKHLGDQVILYSTDGAGTGFLKCGAHPGLLTTVDFGPGNVTAGFQPLIQWNSSTPLVNSEFYTGWLDYWGGQHAHTDTDIIVKNLKDFLDLKANMNFYMFEGGTNFGFTNGADPPYKVCPTSYDYDAPLNEAGDPTPKYMAIRKLMSNYKKLPDVPPATPKYVYGTVTMKKLGTVLDLLQVVSPLQPVVSEYPLTMEQVKWYHGFILYRHNLKQAMSGNNLEVPGIRDMGYVLVNGWRRGLVDRNGVTGLNILAQEDSILDIIVENQGRITYGKEILNNTKGLISNVTIDGQVLTGWSMYPLNFTRVFDMLETSADKTLKFKPNQKTSEHGNKMNHQTQDKKDGMHSLVPTVYTGTFVSPLSEPQDTYLNMTGWFKGQAFLNGFNIGRYWPVRGPQVTLYIPKGVIKPNPAINTLVMVELQMSPCWKACTVHLTDQPVINATMSST